MDKMDKTRDMVNEYYGDTLDNSKDLKTNACCSIESVPKHIRDASRMIADEIVTKFYGCGSPIPLELKGRSVLDLGCGTGKDTYIISSLAGEKGSVVGIDMTDGQLEVANRYLDHQMKEFGFKSPNISFIKGYIEDLLSAGIEDKTFDVVVSNCVVNLSPRKDIVLSEVCRVLKEGGEFYFSDVFVDRRLPEWVKKDPVLVGECLGGALYWKDFERLATRAGFFDIRVFSKKPITIENDDIKDKLGFANFTSVTYRMFKIDGLEDACENFGQKASYNGGIEFSEDIFKLDDKYVFEKGKEVDICGNTALILSASRFKPYFKVIGERSEHYGLFPGCGTGPKVRPDEDCSCDTSGCC